MMKFLSLFLCLLLLTGCSGEPEQISAVTEVTEPSVAAQIPETLPPDPIREILNGMSLEQRVGQLFLARCDDASAPEHIESYHLGGFVLFGQDFQNQTPDSFRTKIAGYQAAAKLPLLIAVDEEGGTVCRVSSNPAFRKQKFASPRQLYKTGGLESVLSEENEKSEE